MTDALDKTADLQALSEAATQGEWWAEGDEREGMEWNFHIMHGQDNRVCFMANMGRNRADEAKANALLIATLVNAYRSGDLVPATAVEDAVKAEREACAKVVESLWAFRTCQEVAAAIRARGVTT